jgi:hypothetical protein
MTAEPAPPNTNEGLLVRNVEMARDELQAAYVAVGDAQTRLQSALRAAFAAGLDGPRLAEILGVSPSRVYQLRSGRSHGRRS